MDRPSRINRLKYERASGGFLETRGRNGTVVSAREDTAQSALQRAASQYATRSRELGNPAETALDYVRAALAAPLTLTALPRHPGPAIPAASRPKVL